MERLYGRRCLIDTNVLVYALDRAAPQHPQAAALVARCAAGDPRGYLTQQNVVELLHVLTRYKGIPPQDALRDVRAFASHPRLTVISPSAGTLGTFLLLVEGMSAGTAGRAAADSRRAASRSRPGRTAAGPPPRIEVFDLFLLATMMTHGIETLVTANADDFRGATLPRRTGHGTPGGVADVREEGDETPPAIEIVDVATLRV